MSPRRRKHDPQPTILTVAPPESDLIPAALAGNEVIPAVVEGLPPNPEDMNDKRAAAAERALLSFAADFGELVEGEDFTSQNLGDLMADFAHLCDRKGLDFGGLLEKAAGYYKEETDNEGRQFEKINQPCRSKERRAVPSPPKQNAPVSGGSGRGP